MLETVYRFGEQVTEIYEDCVLVNVRLGCFCLAVNDKVSGNHVTTYAKEGKLVETDVTFYNHILGRIQGV